MIAESSCYTCRHAAVAPDGSVATCRAFPTQIPEEILRGEIDHHTPVPGDHGIVYEPIGGGPNGDLSSRRNDDSQTV